MLWIGGPRVEHRHLADFKHLLTWFIPARLFLQQTRSCSQFAPIQGSFLLLPSPCFLSASAQWLFFIHRMETLPWDSGWALLPLSTESLKDQSGNEQHFLKSSDSVIFIDQQSPSPQWKRFADASGECRLMWERRTRPALEISPITAHDFNVKWRSSCLLHIFHRLGVGVLGVIRQVPRGAVWRKDTAWKSAELPLRPGAALSY